MPRTAAVKKKKVYPPLEYAVGDRVEYAANTSQEMRVVRVECRRPMLKGIPGFEGLEIRADAPSFMIKTGDGTNIDTCDNTTGRRLWGFDYQIVRVNGEAV